MIYLQLFLSFLKIGAFSFGGGYAAMPMIQQQVVDAYHWLSLSEFGDLVTISQMTPGPIAINAATFVGIRVAGWQGALCATMGCVFPACVIVTAIAYFYVKYRHMEGIQMVLNTLRPAVIALILTGWYFYHLYVPFIEKEKRSDHCHAVCGCAKCDWKLFHFIGNFNEIPYEIKNGNINDESGKSINKTIGSDRFE